MLIKYQDEWELRAISIFKSAIYFFNILKYTKYIILWIG